MPTVANHNRHLDTMVLMTLFLLRLLERLRPVETADYFLRNRRLACFALNIIGVVPVDRRMPQGSGDTRQRCSSTFAAEGRFPAWE